MSSPMLALPALLLSVSSANTAYGSPQAATVCLIEARNLTVEQTQPWQWHNSLLVVGTGVPRIGWQVALTDAAPASTKGQSQSSYHIKASDPATKQVLWDSGIVKSAESLGIEWGGKPLSSRQRVEVTVAISDQDGNACSVSTAAAFETGLLQKADWKAEWIGPPVPRNSSDECGMYADDPAPTFRKTFATKAAVQKARLYGTGLGYYRLYLNGERVGDGALEPAWTAFATRVFYSSYDVTDMLMRQSGKNEGVGGSHVLGAELGKGWWDPLPLKFWGHDNWRDGLSTGTVCLIAQLEVTYTDGTTTIVATQGDGQWKVGQSGTITNNIYLGERYDFRKASPPSWATSSVDDSLWPAAVTYASASAKEDVAPLSNTSTGGNFFCGECGPNEMPNPGMTRYQTLELECPGSTIATIDFAKFGLPEGECGNYHPGTGCPKSCPPYHCDADAKAWVSKTCIGKESCSLDPIHALGDTCPSKHKKLAVQARCKSGTGKAAAKRGTSGPPPPPPPPPPPGPATPGPLEAATILPVRKQPSIGEVVLHTSPAGAGDNPKITGSDGGLVTIIDVGKNIAGVCSLAFSGPAGAEINIRYGELLRPDGSLNAMTSVAGQIKGGQPAKECPGGNAPAIAYQQDVVTLAGSNSKEVFEPKFCWHAFRYVAVAAPQTVTKLTTSDIHCTPLRTDNPVVSEYDSSGNLLLGKIHEMTQRTFENNMMSVQSDCPHRERLGYGGDAHASGEAGMSIFDFSSFYEKRALDYSDAQRPNGGFTEVAPDVLMADGGLGGRSGPIGWEVFQPASLMWLYKYYGNTRALKTHWPQTKKFVDFLMSKPPGIEGGLGDWMPVEKSTPAMTGDAFVRETCLLAANISHIIGEPSSEQQRYLDYAAGTLNNFTEKFFNSSAGIYAAPGRELTQCGQALPLFMGMVPAANKNQAVNKLVESVSAANGNMLVGMFGIKWFLMSLAEAGKTDLAYNSIATETYPSYGYMLNNNFTNATTIWESWPFSDNTFSHDHPMFGSVEVYFMQALGGIQPHPAAKGFDKVLIKPRPPASLPSFGATYHSIRGTISVHWKWLVDPTESFAGRIAMNVTIPPNVVAEIHVPTARGTVVEEEDTLASWSAGDGGVAIITKGSGTYRLLAMASGSNSK